jgi:uncharacterized protein (DUF433 family)
MNLAAAEFCQVPSVQIWTNGKTPKKWPVPVSGTSSIAVLRSGALSLCPQIGLFRYVLSRRCAELVANIIRPYTGCMNMHAGPYKYLARKPNSLYKQLFIKDRWISARTLYGKYAREEKPMTPEEIAADYELPLEAVLEAIAYCESNPQEIASDYAAEEALMEATGMNDSNYDGQPKVLTPQEIARLNRL